MRKAVRAGFLVGLLMATGAQAQCRLALALGLDVSGSVDAREYALQLGGVATALMTPQVRAQVLSTPGEPIWITVFEWSGFAYQRSIVDWTVLQSETDIAQVAATLRQHNRQPAETSTAIGSAMLHAARLFRERPGCLQYTLDVSGDGKNNDGVNPAGIRLRPEFRDVIVNGLVIGPASFSGSQERKEEMMDLVAYFRNRVIHGPGAFIELADGFEDYARAMTRKLLRETRSLVVGALESCARC